MKKRPPRIASELVTKALLENSKGAQSALVEILGKPFDQVPAFDGVIVYADDPSPRFISLSLKGKKKAEPISNVADIDAIKASLCIVMPPIARRP
ncbi:hypothetical protein [Azohydromonas caseinilytica]|uniref:Uncharacterized protein n=1 Tax=Azohydromonas caseinilytica TaxID=2728836 RepID=A0A848F8E3_9BURK|nr:hypothetical protein [Azohydromonas caseinilytica]NML15478.1 hypothetical protein [Azohydromonas caseinilytica]